MRRCIIWGKERSKPRAILTITKNGIGRKGENSPKPSNRNFEGKDMGVWGPTKERGKGGPIGE